MYTFQCEVCGKTVTSKSDPTNWRTRTCWDCKQKGGQTTQAQPQNKTTAMLNSFGGKVVAQTQVKQFDIDKYIEDLFTVYGKLKAEAETRGVEVPEANLCQWVTSILIQKDKK